MSTRSLFIMLQTLRDKMKIILMVVLIAFLATIVFSWGMGGFKDKGQVEQGVLGKVSGQKILYRNFANMLEQEYETFRQNSDAEEINDYTRNRIREQVWQNIVQEILFQKEVEDLNITATPSEVVFQLQNNPPEFLRNHESFQTEGQFDIQKYQQALSDPSNYTYWIPVENYLQNMIPKQKLGQYILSSVRLSRSAIQYNHMLQNTKMTADYLLFDTNSISDDSVEVSEKEIAAYYKENQDDFRVEEKRKIQYVTFNIKPSYADSAQTRQEILDILDQVKAGADFEEMATDYSEDAITAVKGGDLGYLSKGTMVKTFEDAAFSAKKGSVVGPVETDLGTHIIKVLGRKREKGETKVHAQHILLRFEPSSETYDNVVERATNYSESLEKNEKQFESLALESGYAVDESPLFLKGAMIPGIGINERINTFAFNENLNWVSRPVYSQDKWYVFKITDIEESHIQPLDEVKESIVSTLKADNKMVLLKAKCQAVHTEIQNGLSFDEAAEKHKVTVYEAKAFGVNDYVSRIGRDANFTGNAFHLAVDEISKPVKGNSGYYLIKLKEKQEADTEYAKSLSRESIQAELQKLQQEAYMSWYSKVEETGKVEDYRYIYF